VADYRQQPTLQAKANVLQETVTKRLENMDALRGLAAFSVLLWHWLVCSLPPYVPGFEVTVLREALSDPARITRLGPAKLLSYSPLRIFGGGEAVVLFFVLSGYVLSLPLWAPRTFGYGSYVVRRIFRIWVPYVAALALAVAGNIWISTGGLPGQNQWFNATWQLPVHPGEVVAHLTLIGVFDDQLYNTAFWSLIHEMRISLVYPLLILGLRRLKGGALWLLPAPVICFGAWMADAHPTGRFWESVEVLGLFLAGAALARNQEVLRTWFATATPHCRAVFVGVAAMLYTYGWSWVLPAYVLGLTPRYRDLFICVGATGFVFLAIAWPPCGRVLASPPAKWLGKISYSLYLTHATVLFSLVYLCPNMPGLFWVYLLVAVLSATLFAKVIEHPAMRLGRHLTSPDPQELPPPEADRTPNQ